jgi:hypothetical protein
LLFFMVYFRYHHRRYRPGYRSPSETQQSEPLINI